MNMKNKSFIIAFISLALFSCSNSVNDTKNTADYSVKGSVQFSNNSSRTATSSLSDSMDWILTAFPWNEEGRSSDSKKYSPVGYSGGNDFKFVFPAAGKYVIEARGMQSDGVCAVGSAIVEVSGTATSPVTINAEPAVSSILGNVRLTVNIESILTDYIKKVSVTWTPIDESKELVLKKALGYEPNEAVQSDEVQTELDKLDEWKTRFNNGAFSGDFNVSNNRALISINGIFCGAHEVELKFKDENNEVGYSCKEIINVYPGFTTDTWYGSTDLISRGAFTLKSDTVRSYGSMTIINSSPVLFSRGTGNYEFKRSDSTIVTNSITNDFAFDSKGNCYVVKENRSAVLTVVTDRPGTVSEFMFDVDDSCPNKGIIIDSKTDDLYTYTYTNTASLGGHITLNQYSGLLTSESPSAYPSADVEKDIDLTASTLIGSYGNIFALTIYDGVVYIYGLGNGDYKIIKGRYEDNDYSVLTNSIYPVPTSGGECSDMLYYDGYIYILYNYQKISTLDDEGVNLYAYGAVLRFSASDGTKETLGYARDNDYAFFNMADDSEEKYALVNYWDRVWNNTLSVFDYSAEVVYEDSTKRSIKAIDNHFFNETYLNGYSSFAQYDGGYDPENITGYGIKTQFVSPSKEKACFYGAQKIVAIKPKKLVIADSGIAFYTTTDGMWAYKNINRLVTIDVSLGNFLIEEDSITDAGVNFTEKMEDPIPLNASSIDCKFLGAVDAYYYKESTNEWLQSTVPDDNAGLFCLGIPRIE